MEFNKNMSFQHSLYEYEVMTAQQLALLHSYKVSAIYSKISKLNKLGLVGKIDVPIIGRGAKAYHLNSKSARYVAEDRNELSIFREKEWSTAPSGVLSTLLTNQFCCELIRATKEITGSGLTDWKGSKTLFQPFLVAGEKKLPPRMNGSAVFYYDDMARYMYLNVLTGNESITVLNEMLQLHMQMIQEELGERANKALFLFMYIGNAGKMIVKLWKQIVGSIEGNEKVPFLAVASFERLAQEGIFSNVWSTLEVKDEIGLLDMPGLQVKAKLNKEFIGKKQVIKLNFNQVGLVDKNDKIVPNELNGKNIKNNIDALKQEQEDETNENGIDWSLSN